MEQYQIRPWFDPNSAEAGPGGQMSDLYVPAELEALAWQVIEQYDMQVSSMTLITSKPDKGGAIWKIETDKGPRSLKVLHRTPRRSLFSIYAQQYVVEQGARVPALVPNKSGELYVEAGGKAWIVTDWIEQLQPASKIDLEGAAQLCFGLGEFHRYTKGYVPPSGALVSSRIYDWPDYYGKIIEKIGWFRHIAEVYNEHAGSRALLAVIEQFERQAREALNTLNNSAYPRMTAKGDPYWGLVHQDYGWSNGQMGPGGIWVIDLDGVAYDMPIRDLRKLMTSTMDDMGYWDITWLRGMIDAYHAANPMDRETYELLLNDMAFPNEFYKHIKEMVYDPSYFLSYDVEPILQRLQAEEESKWSVLQQLAAEKDKYAPGDYPESASGGFDRWHYNTLGGGVPRRSAPTVPGVPTAPEAPMEPAGPMERVEPTEETIEGMEAPTGDMTERMTPPPIDEMDWTMQPTEGAGMEWAQSADGAGMERMQPLDGTAAELQPQLIDAGLFAGAVQPVAAVTEAAQPTSEPESVQTQPVYAAAEAASAPTSVPAPQANVIVFPQQESSPAAPPLAPTGTGGAASTRRKRRKKPTRLKKRRRGAGLKLNRKPFRGKTGTVKKPLKKTSSLKSRRRSVPAASASRSKSKRRTGSAAAAPLKKKRSSRRGKTA